LINSNAQRKAVIHPDLQTCRLTDNSVRLEKLPLFPAYSNWRANAAACPLFPKSKRTFLVGCDRKASAALSSFPQGPGYAALPPGQGDRGERLPAVGMRKASVTGKAGEREQDDVTDSQENLSDGGFSSLVWPLTKHQPGK
jgi:hypothetical protein